MYAYIPTSFGAKMSILSAVKTPSVGPSTCPTFAATKILDPMLAMESAVKVMAVG